MEVKFLQSLYINIQSSWMIFVLLSNTHSIESVLSVILAPKLNSITEVWFDWCEVQFKDDFCASVCKGPGI